MVFKVLQNLSTPTLTFICTPHTYTNMSRFPGKTLNHIFLCKFYPSFKATVQILLSTYANRQCGLCVEKSKYSGIRNTGLEIQLCHLLAVILGKVPNLSEL